MDDQQSREKEKKKYLRRYRKNIACIARLEKKLKLLDDRLSSPRSPNLSGMPRGSTPVTTSELIADKIELEERISRLKEKGKVFKNEILAEIDSLDDARYCEVLEAYFIDGYSLEKIAEKECYTDRHIYRLYSEAITILTNK